MMSPLKPVDDEEESRGNDKSQAEPEFPAPPRPPADRNVDSALDGKH